MTTPSDPPPSYEQAIKDHPHSLPQEPRNGIPLHARRSMEDELRPLPAGWVRDFDPETQHQFFVDTTATPPRSIWQHPYDDDVYLNSLPAPERERILATGHSATEMHRRPSTADIVAEDSDTDDDDDPFSSASAAALPPRPKKKEDNDRRSLGRRLKDHLTGTTHEERARERERRARAEEELYRQHQALRRAMREAMRTGQPQPLGRDESRGGEEVFIEPPGVRFPGVVEVRRVSPFVSEVVYDERRPAGRYLRTEGLYGGGGGGGLGFGGGEMYGGGGYPYGGGGWQRPGVAYCRVPGRGYGGGLGVPMMAPLFGGMVLGGLAGSMM
ncbi:uncharacterized protein B0T15DRAFT_409892 [Chaetomium strumarium]|uniref:WW domain-containing protein n=1 Tax=Chaetomium strumarium TaxID=1170767 RepID=A0AAJ0GY10_9PEZI|nr:hypothetical protein B0T15DRAFT_409892 [Chaetomium strumarium]